MALVLVVALLGVSGHGLPALGMQMLNGEAWLVNTANRSVSLVNGYSGKVSSQVGVSGVDLQVVNTAGGAVVVGQDGRLVQVSNDNFTTSSPVSPIKLVSGGAVTATAGQNALYALDQATGKIQQLDPSSPQLATIGSPVSVGRPITTPVVAPDGSLYVGIGGSGEVGHVTDGNLVLIRGVSRPGDRLAVVLAGTQVVAADLSQGVVMPLGPTAVSGPSVHLPPAFQAVQMTGSDISNGLVGLISAHAVDSVNVTTRATSPTPLRPAFNATASAMQGQNVVLINSTRHQVLVVDTATHAERTLTMPGPRPPDQITVRDRLVFVNASDGASAMVINGSGGMKKVTKYTGPPPARPKPAKLPAPTPARTKTPVTTPVTPQRKPATPHQPGAPVHPVAAAGNASATVSWGAAPGNGSAITKYLLSWSGSNGSTGNQSVSGGTVGKTVNGLSNGISYVFTIAAVNRLGQGPSASTSAVTPSSSVPDAPTSVRATVAGPGDSVTLTWSAPDNNFHIASYNVSEVGSGAQVASGVTGTSTTIGPSQGLTAGTAVQFQVSAISTSGVSSAPSAPSVAVTPYQDPAAPAVQVSSYSQSGTSAVFSVTCDITCQGGLPAQTYQVTLSPSGPTVPPVPALAGGGATTMTLNGLTPNTSYTAAVTVTDTAGATGPADTVALTTPGPPTVSNLKVTGNGQALDVTATVGTGGEATTCSISVSGGGSASGACDGTISVGVPMYNTSYSVTYTAANAAKSVNQTASGTSGLKALTANATDAFGTCAQYHVQWCGSNSGVEPGPSFTSGGSLGPVNSGTTMSASCWTTGGMDYGNVPPYNKGSNVWIHVTNSPGPGYMTNLWFPSPNSVTSSLPHC
ncbi:MAG: fibronectin type III domain-containing protein [Streptosporangiaceae bacterium]